MQILTMVLLVAIVGGVYLAIVYAPIYIDHYDAKSKCDEAVKSTWRNEDEEKTRAVLHRLLVRIGTEDVVENGEVVKEPIINPDDEDIEVSIDRTITPPMLMVDFSYLRYIQFPLLKKEREAWFSIHCEQKIEEVNWN